LGNRRIKKEMQEFGTRRESENKKGDARIWEKKVRGTNISPQTTKEWRGNLGNRRIKKEMQEFGKRRVWRDQYLASDYKRMERRSTMRISNTEGVSVGVHPRSAAREDPLQLGRHLEDPLLGERERADAGGKVSWSGAGGGEGRGRPDGAVEVLGELTVVAGGGEVFLL
jgi:hypothetical protein